MMSTFRYKQPLSTTCQKLTFGGEWLFDFTPAFKTMLRHEGSVG
jgi:hypothetical protein